MISDPNIAVVTIALGVLGIEAEFCLPGKVVPGVLGGILLLVGTASLMNVPPGERISWPLVSSLVIVVLIVTASLLRVAVRARRNKKTI